jgi:hypothetical protein
LPSPAGALAEAAGVTPAPIMAQTIAIGTAIWKRLVMLFNDDLLCFISFLCCGGLEVGDLGNDNAAENQAADLRNLAGWDKLSSLTIGTGRAVDVALVSHAGDKSKERAKLQTTARNFAISQKPAYLLSFIVLY